MLSLKLINMSPHAHCHNQFQVFKYSTIVFRITPSPSIMASQRDKRLLSYKSRLQALRNFAGGTYAVQDSRDCKHEPEPTFSFSKYQKENNKFVTAKRPSTSSRQCKAVSRKVTNLNVRAFEFLVKSTVRANNLSKTSLKSSTLLEENLTPRSCTKTKKGSFSAQQNINSIQKPLFSVSQRLLIHRTAANFEQKLSLRTQPTVKQDYIEGFPNSSQDNEIIKKEVPEVTAPKVPQIPKEIKLESAADVRETLKQFPHPKSTLHNFYSVLSDELKDKSLRVEPVYKIIKKKKDSIWVCSYHLKWPENLKIIAQALTKKDASMLSAAKSLEILSQMGRISPEGNPLIYQKQEVKQLKKQKQTAVRFNETTIEHMHNIVDVFDNDLKKFIGEVDFQEYSKESVNEEDLKEVGDLAVGVGPKFLGNHKYLAREKVQLPISSYKENFMELLQKNNTVIVKGEPGCGKSSRIPQYVLESWLSEIATGGESVCRIAVTQPRRIAAISLSNRVASERDEQVGHIVGYKVRLKSNFEPRTGRILYCTTGILLRHLQSDPKLSKFSHVVLDEAHERDVNTDLLMNLLKKALVENEKLKLVVMSATIDAQAFSEYFDGAPIMSVPGFTFPVKKHFLDGAKGFPKTLNVCNQDTPQMVHEEVAKLITHIHNTKPEGAILIFLPGWEDMNKIQKLLGSLTEAVVHMVHSKLKDSEQYRIFSRPPPGIRKIILATNIAETSITIDDVVYVVDTGIHKDMIFDFNKGINVIDLAWISQASANQRAGRAGRCLPGEAYHMYTKERYEKMNEYTAPKILNSSLTKVVLDCKVFTNNMQAEEFMDTLITPPERAAVQKAVDELKQLDLLDEQERLTPLGRTLVNFQLEPCLAKAMVNGVIFKCATPVNDIVTLFSSETDIFGSMSLTGKDEVKKVKSEFCKSSDHLALMRVYEKWLELSENDDRHAVEQFCRSCNLVRYKLEFVQKLEDVHLGYLKNGLSSSMPICDDYSDNDELVKAVLYSGTGKVLEHRNWDIVKNRLKTNVNVLVTRNNHKATISTESVNFKRQKFPSNFLTYIQETRSNIRRATIVRECSLVPAITLMLFNGGGLELIEPKPEDDVEENMVIIGIKNTKLRFLCERREAELIIQCKEAIQKSYQYLIYQLTYANEDIAEFLDKWDDILRNLDVILASNRVE